MAISLPGYVTASVPNPAEKRAAWYKNTAPSYAGIFLWVAFYLGLAGPTISQASLSVCIMGLVVAGLVCFGLYYYAPAMLGMQTGRPLYVVGTSTFGTTGGYVMPGLLMGLLQIGWFSVATFFAADFIMKGLNAQSRPLRIAICLVWAYVLAGIAIKGIQYVARVAQFLNWVPLIMILIVLWANKDGISSYAPEQSDSWGGFVTILGMVIGFFATAGAAGADFGMNNRSRRDIVLGGLTGITLAIVIAGGLPLLSVAGHLGAAEGPRDPAAYDYAKAIASAGSLAPVMFFLFAAASLAPTCFCTYIASTSFATMLPKIPKTLSTMTAVTLGAILAVTGVAQNLIGFFTIVGASFGPICGAMAADYFLSGGKWPGPRLGINWAGYVAWAVGFVIGILDKIPGAPEGVVKALRPEVLSSFFAGFIVYFLLAKMGLEPPLVPLESGVKK